ncbi:MAG: DUF4252 domain-containing protein [Bacteroidota bacterium]|nr:DUF4252 domain-containing protein [Bacteroidota bacterium]
MKKIFLSIVITASFLIPSTIQAQSPIDKVFEKYAGQERFTSVNISKEMFQMFQQMANEKNDSMARQVKSMMDNLSSLKILTYAIDSTRMVKAVSIYNEFAGLFPPALYKELMTVNEGREYYKFLTKMNAGGKISEMVMLMKGRREVMVLSLIGTIDLNSLSKLSKGMNIKGMENLEKIKEKKGK